MVLSGVTSPSDLLLSGFRKEDGEECMCTSETGIGIPGLDSSFVESCQPASCLGVSVWVVFPGHFSVNH